MLRDYILIVFFIYGRQFIEILLIHVISLVYYNFKKSKPNKSANLIEKKNLRIYLSRFSIRK